MLSDMNICVLTLDGVFDTGLATVLDTLATANDLAPAGRPRPFRVTLAGVRRRVRTHLGLRVPVVPVPRTRPDVVIVPAIWAVDPEGLKRSLQRPDVAEVGARVRSWAERGSWAAAACKATFVLGDAGLLDGRRATTTWWLAPVFRERYPHAVLDEGQMVVDSRGVVTAGTALAHLDLALWFVRAKSPSLARTVARHLVYDTRPSQAVYVMPDHLAHADPLVERFEHWSRGHLADFSLGRAARAVGASERTLERRFHAVMGKTPVAYLQDLRVEQAVHQLQTTASSIDEIAAAVGYKDGVTLRTLLKRKTGRGLRELRQRG
jgi:transcriptional regulator GlxA family with amidase domain